MRKKISIIFVCALCLVSGVAQAAFWNGDFETGNTSSWWTWIPDTVNSTIAVVSGGPGSSVYAAAIWTANPTPSGPQLGQDIDFSAGAAPLVSMMYDAPAGQWAGASITVQYKDASLAYLDSGWDVFFAGDGSAVSWATYDSATSVTKAGNWVAPAGTAHLTFKITQWGWMPSVTVVQYDNVNVTPEPATMVLLGIGGLVALRRKHA
jgi:hypothetical protein